MSAARQALATLATALLATAALCPAAHADAKSADKAFRKGKKLLEQKRYQEACAAFEDSFRADPAIGAQLNVARCYQEWGKSATAYDAFTEALKLARAAKDPRAPQIKEVIADLEPTVPELVISLPKGRLPPPSLSITVDGADLPLASLGKGMRVDPGPHVVVAKVVGGESRTISTSARAGDNTPVEVPLDELAPPPEAPAEETPAPVRRREPEHAAAPPGRSRRILGLAVGGAGAVAVGVATFVALGARSDYNAAFSDHCDVVTRQCDADGLTRTSDARSSANVATAIGGVGLAAVATGVFLYLTAPKHAETPSEARYLRPTLTSDSVGIALGGSL
jgi:hypothetical protein